MRRLLSVLWLSILVCEVSRELRAAEESSHPLAPVTVVLANADDPESVEIARAYQSARGIPEANIVLLPVSTRDTIDRPTFVASIWNPLRRTLLERGLLAGNPAEGVDLVGREKLQINQSGLRYLVVCRGVPFRVAEMAELDDKLLFPAIYQSEEEGGPWSRFPVQMRKNRASVDNELTLLLIDDAPLTGVLPNPLFRQKSPSSDSAVVRVTRLDGPSIHAVRQMIRNTLRAEEIGLRGRAYFDLARRGGTYSVGENWIRNAAEMARAADFDVTVDEAKSLMGLESRFDAPAIYFGWYAKDAAGVFQLPDVSFPPGAVGAHLHSSSAAQLRQADRGWVGPLVAAGVTATVGNVYEPYLEQTHQFDLLLKGLFDGMNFADAAYAAVPTLSWQTIALGDPLYTPFKIDLAEQMAQLGDSLNTASDPYVVIRQMNQILREKNEPDLARSAGVRGFYRTPGPALALKLAELEAENGDLANARRRLDFAALIARFESQDWALFHQIAQRLAGWGGEKAATLVYGNLLNDQKLPRELRLLLLEEGAKVAIQAGRHEEAVAWRQQWHALSAQNQKQ